jgi:hypothetical protein
LDLAGRPAGADTSLPEPTDPVVRDQERRALIAFYEELGGPDWIQHDFWGSEWHGTEPDADGRVVRLTICDNNLEGRLSPMICPRAAAHAALVLQQDLGPSLADRLTVFDVSHNPGVAFAQ